MKHPIFIAISTQKGGVGKSTLTTLTASYLCYVKGYNVAVIDCDYPQCSIHELRKRELHQVTENAYYKNKAVMLFESLGRQPYPILTSKPEEAIKCANEFLAKGTDSYDVILFDMPGTINNPGMLVTFLSMDYVFTPISPSRIVLESTLTFISLVQDMMKEYPKIVLRDIYLFWNRIDARVKPELIKQYEKVISVLEIKKLDTVIPQSVRFDKEQSLYGTDAVFLSTIFPPDRILLRGSNIDALVDEITKITGLKNDRR